VSLGFVITSLVIVATPGTGEKITVRGVLARKLRLALTALAIVLGVTFVTGTLVLTDTLNRTFDTLIGTA
jgi:hypothetical protein